jgi:hypothetical protein
LSAQNPILDKNLECIGKYNPKLKENLRSLTSLNSNFELIDTEIKEPNLFYNGVPLHATNGAEIEAKKIFESTPNTPSSMHVVFGMGLGFLFQEFCKNSKGIVIVYEPNLEILRVTLELVDFSAELSQPNVFIVSDLESFKHIFMTKYSYSANATFVFLNSYKLIYSNEIGAVFGQIELITGICMAEYNTLRGSLAHAIEMTISNISYTLEETPLNEIKDAYKGKTALIVSAGPSLDLNIETIKQNRNKVVIFCVGTAVKALIKNGITPDFLNLMEVNDCSGQVNGLDLSGVNLILEPYTNTSIHKLKTKEKFTFSSQSTLPNVCWSQIVGTDISPYTTKGSVSYEALFSAKILGFTRMILVGQDLAYVNNQVYSKDSAYAELAFEINPETNKAEVRIKDHERYVKSLTPTQLVEWTAEDYKAYASVKLNNLNDTLYYVDGIQGDKLPTQGGYATFIEHFREFAAAFSNLELINSSMIGAEIKGFKNMPLAEALTFVAPLEEKPDFSLAKHFYDKKQILNNLNKEEEILKKILKEFETASNHIYNYQREFNRRRIISKETNKHFKLLLTLYNKITTGNELNSAIYKSISFSENLEVSYLLKNSQVVDADHIQNFFEQLKIYFVEAKPKLEKIITLINKQKEIIVESINSAG